MKVVRWGDHRGVGSIVERKTFWGSVRTWTCVSFGGGPDKWVCRETGDWEYASEILSKVHAFYKAQYNTRGDK